MLSGLVRLEKRDRPQKEIKAWGSVDNAGKLNDVSGHMKLIREARTRIERVFRDSILTFLHRYR